MITPAYSPTATERVLPRMALDFTTGVLDPRVAVTRALNTATRINSSGVIEIVNANLPRFDYDPATLVAKGLLIEETRTNLFLNSLIDGTLLVTQTVVVTAVAHTISFYGTGTITLSGAATATVTGTGVYPNRKTLTFTPTAGALICTVTGSVQYAQLEVGAFVTSFIPTDATSVARNADTVAMTGTNFSDWYNSTQGTFFAQYSVGTASTFVFSAVNSTTPTTEVMYLRYVGSQHQGITVTGGAIVSTVFDGTGLNAVNNVKTAFAYKASSYGIRTNGGSLSGVNSNTTSGALPSGINKLVIGANQTGTAAFLNGCIAKLSYYNISLLNAELSAVSK